jgi:hypothetical protein
MLDALEAAAVRECPLARQQDVAEYVARVAGAALARRRERISACPLPSEPVPSEPPLPIEVTVAAKKTMPAKGLEVSEEPLAQVANAHLTQSVRIQGLSRSFAHTLVLAALALLGACYALWPTDPTKGPVSVAPLCNASAQAAERGGAASLPESASKPQAHQLPSTLPAQPSEAPRETAFVTPPHPIKQPARPPRARRRAPGGGVRTKMAPRPELDITTENPYLRMP